MREIRTSGSVEGVPSDGHPYSDSVDDDDAIVATGASTRQCLECRAWALSQHFSQRRRRGCGAPAPGVA